MNKVGKINEGLGWRVNLSIVIGVGWLIFILLWLAFYGTGYSVYENISIFFLSILIIAVILGIPWMSWYFKHQTHIDKEMWKTEGFKSRVWISVVLAFILGFFNIYWFWYNAFRFSPWQNIAVFIISVLVIGGILGIYWAPWGMKYGDKFNKPGEKYKVEEEIDKELSKKKD